MAIETSRIRGPSEALNPNFVLVPVATDERGSRSGEKDGKDQGAEARKGESDSRRHDDHNKPPQPPSLTRTLVFSGIVALICGVVGAWGYSYFFGSSSSGDEKTSGKSGSSKGADSSKGSDSGKGSGAETSQNGEDRDKIRQAESAWMMAVKDLHAAQASEQAARRSELETRSILDFFKKTLLSAGRPVDASLSDVFWAGGPAKDVTLRKAVDVAESQVAETFTERPLAEASVREMLGLAYLTVGEPAQAVKQYERAFALRQALQGVNNPDAAACRNQLAVAYRLAGRTAEGGRLFDHNPNSAAYAATLLVSGSMLLAQKHPLEAELKLRECLTIRQKIQPNDWTTFDTKSVLGEALLDQDRFADAESLLLSGYEGMKQREASIPPSDHSHLTRAMERLVRLYESWGKEAEMVRWRKIRDAAGP
jgi:tetratricopeptide (TPR) repeat protein